MTATTRRFITITILMTASLVFLANDLHKDLIAAVWPHLEAFTDYLTR
jgi:hypothetical protein